MSQSDHVTIGVPVYRGEAFLGAALESIQSQTHRNFEVLISLDGPDSASEAVCAPFLKDSRLRLAIQPQRLGWVGNINWLMSQAQTGYWYYHQQDDLVDPRYLEVLLEYAGHTAEAAVVYCDIMAFGLLNCRFTQPSVTGNASARQLALLHGHHPAVAFRGLTRVEALRLSGGVPQNDIENFSADTAWMATVARWGELHRVPMDLYRKRYHDANEHMKWFAWPLEKRVTAWIHHCASMLEQATLVEATAQERRLLWLAAVGRLVSPVAAGHVPLDTLTSSERLSMLDRFFAHVAVRRSMDIPRWLDASWEVIQAWTRGFFWVPTSARPPSVRTPTEAARQSDADTPSVAPMMNEVVQMLTHHLTARQRHQHVLAVLERPRLIERGPGDRPERFTRLAHILVKHVEQRFRLLEAVATRLREIDGWLSKRGRDPSRHPRHELREMAEREGFLVRLPRALLARNALQEATRHRHLLIEFFQRNCWGDIVTSVR